jgi:hypothetical protein
VQGEHLRLLDADFLQIFHLPYIHSNKSFEPWRRRVLLQNQYATSASK